MVGSRQAGADYIELTEAMLMAGLNALIQFRGEGDEETVREIARAILHQLPGSAAQAIDVAVLTPAKRRERPSHQIGLPGWRLIGESGPALRFAALPPM